MKIYLGADHAGFPLKEILVNFVKEKGHETVDLGVFTDANKVDYPDLAREVGEKVRENEGSLGILVCGTGIGVSIAANKLNGIRAANVHHATEARLARQHNNANIVALGQRVIGPELAKDIVDVFLNTDFDGGRHIVRIEKIKAIENEE